MQDVWPGRITVYRVDDDRYLQEATTFVMMHVGLAAAFDWVYVFDADEFLLLAPGLNLAELLMETAAHIDAVRYEVDQWVAPADFDDTDLQQYGRIRHRAVPNIFLDSVAELLMQDIEQENINYFDTSFFSKVIVRGYHAHAICAGAHGLKLNHAAVEARADAGQMRAAHLPLLSKRRLTNKCSQGQALIDAGFPPSHGWQSQMLRRIELNGRLDTFWTNHSWFPERPPSDGAIPNTTEDLSLAAALEKSVVNAGLLAAAPLLPKAVTQQLQPDRIPIGPAIQAINSLLTERDAAVVERDTVTRSRIWRATAWLRRLRSSA